MSVPVQLDSERLTDHQWDMCAKARKFPVILTTRGMAITAASLARNGWGDVEDGASGERIFRMNQAGCDAMALLDDFAPGGTMAVHAEILGVTIP